MYLDSKKSIEVWCQVEQDAVYSPVQSQASNKQYGKEEVGQGCRHIDNLK